MWQILTQTVYLGFFFLCLSGSVHYTVPAKLHSPADPNSGDRDRATVAGWHEQTNPQPDINHSVQCQAVS